VQGIFEDWTLETIYFGCAVVGGAVLLLQTLLLLFGGDVDGESDVDGDSDGFSLLSLRAIASFLAFFGLAGWGGTEAGWSTAMTMGVAMGAGLAMLFAVAWLMTLFRKAHEQGNIDPANAVGLPAKVYLRIPGKNKGKGKITVSVQSRSVEFQAMTSGKEIPTGAEVRILSQTTPDTFEVEPL
jgi:hypothetical protein